MITIFAIESKAKQQQNKNIFIQSSDEDQFSYIFRLQFSITRAPMVNNGKIFKLDTRFHLQTKTICFSCGKLEKLI